MLKKDYLIRQFEEFGKVMAVIFGLKLKEDWQAYEEQLQAAAERFTGNNLASLEGYSVEEFELKIVLNETLSQDQKKIIAALLFEKLTYYLSIYKEKNAEALKLNCIKLYKHLQENLTHNEYDLDVYYKLEALQKL